MVKHPMGEKFNRMAFQTWKIPAYRPSSPNSKAYKHYYEEVKTVGANPTSPTKCSQPLELTNFEGHNVASFIGFCHLLDEGAGLPMSNSW